MYNLPKKYTTHTYKHEIVITLNNNTVFIDFNPSRKLQYWIKAGCPHDAIKFNLFLIENYPHIA